MRKAFYLLVLASLSLTGCHQFGGGVRASNSPHHHPATLPPAHAPAHGRRAQYRYYYYPEARFYFDIGRNLYFYLDSSGRWSVSARFPSHLHHYRNSRYVEIEIANDKPYHHYHEHRKKYPPGQVKKKYKHNKKYKNKKYDDDDEYEYKGKRRYDD